MFLKSFFVIQSAVAFTAVLNINLYCACASCERSHVLMPGDVKQKKYNRSRKQNGTEVGITGGFPPLPDHMKVTCNLSQVYDFLFRS